MTEWTKYIPGHVLGKLGAVPRSAISTFGLPAETMEDGLPFTTTNVLAHTFYPASPNPESIAGDMHLNASETWAIGGQPDVFSLALHETGHALGLGHSDDPADIMYAIYKPATGLYSRRCRERADALCRKARSGARSGGDSVAD